MPGQIPGLARRLRERLGRSPGPEAGSGRIVLVGNCQASAIARVMRLLLPGFEIDYLSAGVVGRRRRGPEAFAAAFDRYERVFVQRIASGHVGPEHYAALARRHEGCATAPNLVFAAFHPDLVYVGGPGSGRDLVGSPVGHYHAALALYAYLAGLRPEQALRLFDGEVFGHLGYLDLWGYASDTLLTLGQEAGLDLAEPLVRWTRRGLFMHSTNHPRLFVLADVARLLLERAGLGFADFDVEPYLVDDLALKGMWPVYEPVGLRYGLGGAYVFQTQRLSRRETRPGRIYGLQAFVEGSYERYAALPRAQLVCDRVETWLASDDLRTVFRHYSG